MSQVSGTDSLIKTGQTQSSDVAIRLEGLRKKELTLSLHQSTLVDYIKVNRIPRGLRSNLTPNLLTDDPEFLEYWYGICNQSSQDLMYLMVKHLQKKVQQVKKEIEDTEQELLETYPAERASEVNKTIEITTQRLRESILKTKARKFERDAKDYELNEVYTWNKKTKRHKRSPQPARSTPTNPTFDLTTSDSENSASSGSRRKKRSFFGRPRPRTEDHADIPQDPQHPGTSHQGAPQRPQTRAWSGRGRGRSRGRPRR